MKITSVNLQEKFDQFSDLWSPKIVGRLNGQLIKVVKVKDEFVMHAHADEDEMFYVVKGKLSMKMEDETIEVNEGEFIIIPKGVRHCPIAEEETQIMLFEPETTENTGGIDHAYRVDDLEQI